MGVAAVGLACLVGLWSLRGLDAGGLVTTDAARHAMNGALIHDWLREGPWTAPGEYANWYYSRWPSLSLGYHPPVFPILEAVTFGLLGVSAFAARLLVALTAALCFFLFHRLVYKTHGSPVLSLAAGAVFAALPVSQRVAQDVMLEYPTLLFVLLALHALPAPDSRWTPWHAVVFSASAGAAVWTKQLAVFLGAVPLLVALGARREWLRSRAMWASTLAVGVCFLGLGGFEMAFGLDAPRRFSVFRGIPRALLSNVPLYFGALTRGFGAVMSVVLVAALAITVWNRKRLLERMTAEALYWAWAIAVLAALIPGKWSSIRYLFFAWPPLIVLTLSSAHRFLRWALPERVAVLGLVTFAAALCAVGLGRPTGEYRGPAAAADIVAADHPTRVLYCGEADGHFAFALRAAAGSSEPIVIRGEKLPAATLTRAAFDDFAARYGLSHVVLEDTARSTDCTALIAAPSPALARLGGLPISGVRTGSLHLFRFTRPSATPANRLRVSSDKMGNATQLTLDWSTPPWRGKSAVP